MNFLETESKVTNVSNCDNIVNLFQNNREDEREINMSMDPQTIADIISDKLIEIAEKKLSIR